jgi:hypothetical protein
MQDYFDSLELQLDYAMSALAELLQDKDLMMVAGGELTLIREKLREASFWLEEAELQYTSDQEYCAMHNIDTKEPRDSVPAGSPSKVSTDEMPE